MGRVDTERALEKAGRTRHRFREEMTEEASVAAAERQKPGLCGTYLDRELSGQNGPHGVTEAGQEAEGRAQCRLVPATFLGASQVENPEVTGV